MWWSCRATNSCQTHSYILLSRVGCKVQVKSYCFAFGPVHSGLSSKKRKKERKELVFYIHGQVHSSIEPALKSMHDKKKKKEKEKSSTFR
jgi:hypothetical protein